MGCVCVVCVCRYGAAGAEIIQRNLGLSGGSTIETFSAGRNVDAVFAFCDIRKFTNTTEVCVRGPFRMHLFAAAN